MTSSVPGRKEEKKEKGFYYYRCLWLWYDQFWNQSAVSWWTPVNQVTSSYQIRHKNHFFDCSHDQFPSTRDWCTVLSSFDRRVAPFFRTYLHFPPLAQGLTEAVHSPFSPWYWHRSPSNKSFLVGANLGWEQLQKKSLKEEGGRKSQRS